MTKQYPDYESILEWNDQRFELYIAGEKLKEAADELKELFEDLQEDT